MTLQERVAQEIKAAMLAKDADRLSTLRLLKSAIGYAQIERKTENLSDAEVVAIIQKELKKRRDSVEQFEKGNRPELAVKETYIHSGQVQRAILLCKSKRCLMARFNVMRTSGTIATASTVCVRRMVR